MPEAPLPEGMCKGTLQGRERWEVQTGRHLGGWLPPAMNVAFSTIHSAVTEWLLLDTDSLSSIVLSNE